VSDLKIGRDTGQSGGAALTADLTGTFQRKDGSFINPFAAIPSQVPPATAGFVGQFSGAGGSSTAGAGATAASALPVLVTPSGLNLAQGGVVPGSLLTAAGTAVASTASETELAFAAIPAGDVVAGSAWLLKAGGVYSDTGTPTLAFGLRLGGAAGTSIATIAATTLGSGVSNLSWAAELVLVFYDTTHAVGHMLVDLGTSNSTNATTRLTSTSGNAGVAVTTATAKHLSLTATWGASSSSNTISPMWQYGMRLA